MERHAPPRPSIAYFEQSLLPMLVVDDERRLVDVNRAACLLLRVSRERALELTGETLTPAENRAELDSLWSEFRRAGALAGRYQLALPNVKTVEVEYSATADITPGRHLTVFLVPTIDPSDAPAASELDAEVERSPLSPREREVLARVAMGETGEAIADALSISTATVETHVRHCLAKLGAKNRPHAIALALQRGEIAVKGGAALDRPGS